MAFAQSLKRRKGPPSSSNTPLNVVGGNVGVHHGAITERGSESSRLHLSPDGIIVGTTSSLNLDFEPYVYVDSGDCEFACEFCGDFFWSAERVSHVARNRAPRYNQCCKAGRVRVRLPHDPPAIVKELYQRPDFLDSIRSYNSMFSMTSFGAVVDNSINRGIGPYVFRVEGQICHWIGTLCPPPNERPRFLQMYVYDTDHEVSNRMHLFGGDDCSCIRVEIVELLMSLLEKFNSLVKLFRSARELCLRESVPDFSIRLFGSANQRSYDCPAVGTIGVIVLESPPPADDFDIVIHSKSGMPQRINKLHPLYMSLQYPLLFFHGESGWSPHLRLIHDEVGGSRKLSMNMYYSYLLHDRHGVYFLLLNGGRLFQQFLVDAYICIEQSRLDYIRSHQNLFRTEFLQGVHDALLRGDTEGRSIGKRVVLPASFTGGPLF